MLNCSTRFSIRAKLIAGFALVLMTTIGLGLFSMQRMSLMDQASEVVRSNYLPSVMGAAELSSLAQKLRVRESESRHILSTDPADMRSEEKSMDDLLAFTRRGAPSLIK